MLYVRAVCKQPINQPISDELSCCLSHGSSAAWYHSKAYTHTLNYTCLSPLTSMQTYLQNTLAHSVSRKTCLYIDVACAETDSDVLSCFNLYCSQSTGVLSLSFHSSGHTWNRDTAQTHTHSLCESPLCLIYSQRGIVRKQVRIFFKTNRSMSLL